ncbi:hypothetical protein Slin_3151 [Spirosoma linguale DSM 74]|uniref:Uncharacterized protein n=1 Tax=Spirosoma linguale (strain ATCC 33905 / DSM 74 / LMG 10896 / Claus 1) TaxID=504472 RepID=D2QM99_SPILD|nr:hypothetical protein Slin_3151 [Spirosoma linguale DSM 74]
MLIIKQKSSFCSFLFPYNGTLFHNMEIKAVRFAKSCKRITLKFILAYVYILK